MLVLYSTMGFITLWRLIVHVYVFILINQPHSNIVYVVCTVGLVLQDWSNFIAFCLHFLSVNSIFFSYFFCCCCCLKSFFLFLSSTATTLYAILSLISATTDLSTSSVVSAISYFLSNSAHSLFFTSLLIMLIHMLNLPLFNF